MQFQEASFTEAACARIWKWVFLIFPCLIGSASHMHYNYKITAIAHTPDAGCFRGSGCCWWHLPAHLSQKHDRENRQELWPCPAPSHKTPSAFLYPIIPTSSSSIIFRTNCFPRCLNCEQGGYVEESGAEWNSINYM